MIDVGREPGPDPFAPASSTDRPWLSVIVPTYNGSQFLGAALNSVVAQSDSGVEVIAVDDGSTDDTLAILERFSQRMRMTILSRRVGNWVANTNLGLSKARAEYACVLHQDDLWQPRRLALLRALIAAEPTAVMAFHSARFVGPTGRGLGPWRCPLPSRRGIVPSRRLLERLLVQNFIAMPSPVFHRATVLEAGGLKEHLWYTADWDLWLTLAELGPVVYSPEALACFRLHRHSQTIEGSRTSGIRDQLEEVFSTHLGRVQDRIGPLDAAVVDAARFSIEVNVALAARLHGQRAGLLNLGRQWLALGGQGRSRFLRDSCLLDRVVARLRVGFA